MEVSQDLIQEYNPFWQQFKLIPEADAKNMHHFHTEIDAFIESEPMHA